MQNQRHITNHLARINLVGGILLGAALGFFIGDAVAADPNEGMLNVAYNVEGQSGSDHFLAIKRDQTVPFPITEGRNDVGEGENPPGMEGMTDVYSTNPEGGEPLDYDFIPENSPLPFNLRYGLNGTVSNAESSMVFSYGSTSFGDHPIVFAPDNPLYGPAIDVRRAINQNSGNVPLPNTNGEYHTGTLEIGTRLISDFDDSNVVDANDLTTIADGWLQEGTGLEADISGPKGIPDGKVNNFDLGAFSSEWQQSPPL